MPRTGGAHRPTRAITRNSLIAPGGSAAAQILADRRQIAPVGIAGCWAWIVVAVGAGLADGDLRGALIRAHLRGSRAKGRKHASRAGFRALRPSEPFAIGGAWVSIQNGINIVERDHPHIGPAFDGCGANVRERKGVLESNIAGVEFWLSVVHIQVRLQLYGRS